MEFLPHGNELCGEGWSPLVTHNCCYVGPAEAEKSAETMWHPLLLPVPILSPCARPDHMPLIWSHWCAQARRFPRPAQDEGNGSTGG